MGFELGQTYSEYEFLDVVRRSRSIIAYRVRNLTAARLELLQVLPQTAQDDGEQVDRFLRETRVRANLRHPNIAVFYNAAPLEGQWVMTTELVEGPTLAERLQLGSLHWPQAVGLAIQALSALSCAHENNIIHRDISAESIVVTPDGTLKLSNFALAKTTNGPQLTQAGTIIGNLRYISPEQIRGGELDARSDIYSLGIVLYEMLCGAAPFDTRSQFELMLAHVNKTPLPPSIVNPGVPGELDNIVLKALAKDPGERYQSAAEFSEALLAVGLGGSEAAVEDASAEAVLPAPAAEPVVEAMEEPAAEAVSETCPEPPAPEPVAEAPAEPVVSQFAQEPVAEPEALLPPAEPEPAVETPAPVAAQSQPEPVTEPEALTQAVEPEPAIELVMPAEPAAETPEAVAAEFQPEPVTEPETLPQADEPEPAVEPVVLAAPEPGPEIVAECAIESPAVPLDPVPEPWPLETLPEPTIVNVEQAAAEDPVAPLALLPPPEPAFEPLAEPPEPAPLAMVEPTVATPEDPVSEPTAALNPPVLMPPQVPEQEPVLVALGRPKTVSLQWAVLTGAAAGIGVVALAIWLMSGT